MKVPTTTTSQQLTSDAFHPPTKIKTIPYRPRPKSMPLLPLISSQAHCNLNCNCYSKSHNNANKPTKTTSRKNISSPMKWLKITWKTFRSTSRSSISMLDKKIRKNKPNICTTRPMPSSMVNLPNSAWSTKKNLRFTTLWHSPERKTPMKPGTKSTSNAQSGLNPLRL